MEHLFLSWPEVSRQLKAARRVALFSDYDGTLAPIVERPELAEMPGETRKLLEIFARQRRHTVGILSGRALSDLRDRLNIKGIVYAGNHGLEIEGPGIHFVDPVAEELRPILKLMHRALTRALRAIRGILVENKGLTLSVHYRLAGDQEEGQVRSIFDGVVANARSLGKIRVTNGKKVLEVRPPVDWDKGRAIVFLIDAYARRNGKDRALPIFLGDDLTDEDGFKVLKERNGISIYVGEESTCSSARYFLKSPDEVREFLARLLECRGGVDS
ncbi:MAG: trehalose-phosphatase [Chloroflexi bacterium]|nr:trehalose-phosphatase [Chloroflexota bacterium]